MANKRIAQIGRQQAQRGHGFIHRAACLFSGVSCQCDGFVLFFLCVQAFINQVAQRRGGERRISDFLAALVLCPVGIQARREARIQERGSPFLHAPLRGAVVASP